MTFNGFTGHSQAHWQATYSWNSPNMSGEYHNGDYHNGDYHNGDYHNGEYHNGQYPAVDYNSVSHNTMDRFLYGTDRPYSPGAPGLEGQCHRPPFKTPYSSVQPRKSEVHGPFPTPDEYQRQVSPDSTTFSSSNGWETQSNADFSSQASLPTYNYGNSSDSSQYDTRYRLSSPCQHTISPRMGASGVNDSVSSPTPLVALSDIQATPDISMDHMDESDRYPAYVKNESDVYTSDLHTQSDAKFSPEHDSAIGDSIPDAESITYDEPRPESDSEDDDYTPKKRSTRAKRRISASSANTSHRSARTARTCIKISKSSATTSSPTTPAARRRKRRTSQSATKTQPGRPFPCPLALYGCLSTFSTKNEWKRHVATQHVKTGYWQCDICPLTTDTSGTPYANEFNRKDLFTQHLRRMHTPSARNGVLPPAGGHIPPVNQETEEAHQKRCWQRLRGTPGDAGCLFCEDRFGNWEERMEHVGKHMERDAKLGGEIGMWREDRQLERWLEGEGLIVREGPRFVLGDGVPRREESRASEGESEELESDVDADGEEED